MRGNSRLSIGHTTPAATFAKNPALEPVFAIASDITCPLGECLADCARAVINSQTAIRQFNPDAFSNVPYMAARFDSSFFDQIQAGVGTLTPFETLAAHSVRKALAEVPDIAWLPSTVFILATTKGNIGLLDRIPETDVLIATSAEKIAAACNCAGKVITVSNACTSGTAALVLAGRLLRCGQYRHAVVCGCDIFSRFILSGFQSFMAVSDELCRPFDKDRKGINPGEAAATIVLSAGQPDTPLARLAGGATTNDAHHISAPSRTGAELSMAVNRALEQAGISAGAIGMISCHGTATVYNDEMEAKAFHASGLSDTPLHSLKGYTGHTFGAAGVLETALALDFMQRGELIPTRGYEVSGVTVPLHITTQRKTADYNYLLKTSSGFGGCNAATVWERV